MSQPPSKTLFNDGDTRLPDRSQPASELLPLLQGLLDQLPVGLLVTDVLGNVLLANQPMVTLLGQDLAPYDTLQGLLRRAVAIDASAARSERQDILHALCGTDELEGELSLSLNGQSTRVRLRKSTIHAASGETIGRVALAAQPDHGPVPLSEAERLLRAHQFTQGICHDLRNPLSAITINATILSREERVADDRRIKVANRIVASATRMNRMIEDLFDYALVSQGKAISVRPTDTDLTVIASEALDEARAANPGRSIVLHQKGDLRGQWDSAKLRQALNNILLSALKAGQPTHTIVVGCAETDSPPGVEIHLEDQEETPGSAPPIAQAVVDGCEPALYVAKRIVEAHHGTVSVSSNDGTSPRFTIRLPKRVTRDAAAASPSPALPSS